MFGYKRIISVSVMAHHFVPNKSKITFLNAKSQIILYLVFHQIPYCEKIQGIQRNLSLCRVKQKTSDEFAWPLSHQMALYEKPSCCSVKYSHMGSGVLQKNCCHLTQSAAASRNAIWISFTQGESYKFYAVITPDSQDQSSSQIVKKKQWKCVLCSNESTFQLVSWEKWMSSFQSQRPKGPSRLFISERCKSTRLSWYGGAAEQTAWVTGICVKVPWTWRHILGFYRDILPSRWCLSWEVHGYQIKTMPALILHVLQQHGFIDACACDWLTSRSVSYWTCTAHHEKKNQTTMTTDWWASEVLYLVRLGKILLTKLLRISILNSQTIKHL